MTRLLVLLSFLAAACSSAEDPSIVLVVADTLRADHLGLYGHERDTSPELDAWAQRAAVFESAHASSPWTLPSFATLLTGEIPTRHLAGAIVSVDGKDEYLRLSRSVTTLTEELQERGYATGAFVNNPYLRPAFGLDRGFDHYDHAPATNDAIRRADEVVDAAIAWLDEQGERPVFLLVHLFDPHMDYDPAPEDRGRFVADPSALPVTDVHSLRERAAHVEENEREQIRAAYDEEIVAVDRAVGRLLSDLDRRGLLETGLAIFTADHGEELFDRGGFDHGHSMYEEVLRVPLLAWGAGVQPRRLEDSVSLADVAPTLRELTGLDAGAAFGRSFLGGLRGSQVEPRDVVAEMNLYGNQEKVLLRGTEKLVCDPGGTRGRLFDLERDPLEREDLSGPDRARFHELAFDLLLLLEQESARREDHGGVGLDTATLEELQNLGYLGADSGQ